MTARRRAPVGLSTATPRRRRPPAYGPLDVQYVTLTPSTVAAVTLAAYAPQVRVLNLGVTAAVYFTIDGSTPTIGGPGGYVAPAGALGGAGLFGDSPAIVAGPSPAVVKLISAAAVPCVVMAV